MTDVLLNPEIIVDCENPRCPPCTERRETKRDKEIKSIVKWFDGWIQAHKKRVPPHYKTMRRAIKAREVLQQMIAAEGQTNE